MSKAKSWFYEDRRRDGKCYPTPFVEEKKRPSVMWRKKYKCKKLKGDHIFKIHHIRNRFMRWRDQIYGLGSYVEWHCTGCSKHEHEYFYDERAIASRRAYCLGNNEGNKKLHKHRPGY